ncbi:hypothetical protein ARMGADRAFT_1146859 [Armillaria gallica]|uniref:Uncharacterized protein n=1 Tax=Armillaria gallica TaxID=47427 RepID=A0A2H3CD06_ARMGA|nr:hypothetical protein ARMGADRAFT_1146859 [Armillaria gallica]
MSLADLSAQDPKKIFWWASRPYIQEEDFAGSMTFVRTSQTLSRHFRRLLLTMQEAFHERPTRILHAFVWGAARSQWQAEIAPSPSHGDVSPLKANIVHGFGKNTDTLETPRRQGSTSTSLTFTGRIEGSLPNSLRVMPPTGHYDELTARALPQSKLDSAKGRSVGGILISDAGKGLPTFCSSVSRNDSNNEYEPRFRVDRGVDEGDWLDPDAGERVDESSLRKSAKDGGVDAPTKTGAMSIVTIRKAEIINNPA